MNQAEINSIIEQVKTGDTSSFELLIEAHKDMVYHLALKISKNTVVAEEIAQDSFLKAYEGLNKFKGNSKFSTWLYQITYYTALNKLRGNSKVTEVGFKEVSELAVTESLDDLELSDKKKYLNEALLQLMPEERAVISLFYLDEMSTKEVAEVTKMTVSNVKVKVHRARKKMYSILSGMLQKELNSIRYE